MRRELLLLREMRDAAVAIREVVGDRTSEQIEADLLRRSALLWHFTVLGEAASQVPSETKDSHPSIARRAATRLRNRIVHGYWDIDIETLATTAADDLPQMITQLGGALAALQELDESDPPDMPAALTPAASILAHRTRCGVMRDKPVHHAPVPADR